MTAERKAPIYIVDDEDALGQMAHEILSMHGYHTVVFSDPCAALESLRSAAEKPQLLITDGMMGPMNGLELIEEFKRLVPRGKAILVSGTITGDIVRDSSTQPDSFISKPYPADKLLRAVAGLLPDEPATAA